MPNRYPNQKSIIIQKSACDKNNPYATISTCALETAMRSLKGEAFKLWIYLARNRNGLTTALSASHAIVCGIGSKSSYDRAVKTLVESGYLVQIDGNNYAFFDLPQNDQRNNK